MTRTSLKWSALTALAFTFLFLGCPSGNNNIATLSMSANPRAIDDMGEMSMLAVDATDEKGVAGTGAVTLSAPAGQLGAMSVTLDKNGHGTTTFSCAKATDMGCKNSVKITASWTSPKSGMVNAFVNMVVGPQPIPDAGSDAGNDAGTGSDGGNNDAGNSVDQISVALEKPSLVINTGDHLDVTATLTVRASGAPVPATMMTFTTNAGSFASAPGTVTATAVTDGSGVATVTLYSANATAGFADVNITALDAVTDVFVNLINVASIVHKPDATEKSILGIQSGGRETTTPVVFLVLDANNNPAPGVLVDFSIGPGSASGSVTTSAISDAMGFVKPILQTGNDVGTLTVVAVVDATMSQPSPITATAAIPVVGGKPSFSGLVVGCQYQNLGALSHQPLPPTRTLTTPCVAHLADRFGNVVGLPTQVSWFAEKGTTVSPILSLVDGTATTTYDTTSNQLPQDLSPLVSPAEPSLGAANPRDALITIVGVVSGEEDFADVNNNGKWDPGEWFLDLPEPFVDENDNQQWDPGEQFLDTQRTDCATGQLQPKNMKWDPPNGCWDNNTQIWAVTHVSWSGPSIGTGPTFFSQSPPWTIAPNEVKIIDFYWPDGYLGRIDHTSAQVSVGLIGMRGSVVLSTGTAPEWAADGLGLGIDYQRLEATETSAGSGVFTVNGPCNFSSPGPTNPLTRCIYQYSFNRFGTGVANQYGDHGQLIFTGPSPQSPLPDGGVAPPVQVTIQLTAQDQYFTPVTVNYSAFFQ